MKRIAACVMGFIVVLTAGCASGPAFNDMKASIAPTPTSQGRIYFYRTATYGTAVRPDIYLNGTVVGGAIPAGFFYVDKDPGKCEVVASTEAENKLTFMLEKGQTRYVRLDMRMGFLVGHVVPILVDESDGAKEIQDTKYAEPKSSK